MSRAKEWRGEAGRRQQAFQKQVPLRADSIFPWLSVPLSRPSFPGCPEICPDCPLTASAPIS